MHFGYFSNVLENVKAKKKSESRPTNLKKKNAVCSSCHYGWQNFELVKNFSFEFGRETRLKMNFSARPRVNEI